MAIAKQIPHLAGLMTIHQEHLGGLSVEGAQEAARNPAEFMKCAVEAWNRRMKDLPMPNPRFRIDNEGIIHFAITSDGTTGGEWINRLERHTGKPVGEYAKSVLRSSKFKPTNNVTTNVDVLPGKMWDDDAERTTKNIRTEASRRKMTKLNAEAACLIRMMFTDAELETMGLLWIITMHDPIKDSGGDPGLLGSNRLGRGLCLNAYYGKPGSRWSRESGFAFEAPQV